MNEWMNRFILFSTITIINENTFEWLVLNLFILELLTSQNIILNILSFSGLRVKVLIIKNCGLALKGGKNTLWGRQNLFKLFLPPFLQAAKCKKVDLKDFWWIKANFRKVRYVFVQMPFFTSKTKTDFFEIFYRREWK